MVYIVSCLSHLIQASFANSIAKELRFFYGNKFILGVVVTSKLADQRINYTTWRPDEESTILPGGGFLEVNNLPSLFQTIGYLKYFYREEGNILLRGQCDWYGSLSAKLFRPIDKDIRVQSRIEKIGEIVQNQMVDVNGKQVLSDVPIYAREPLLQHYGLSTQWLDFVDNIWVALWFACHQAVPAPGGYSFRKVDSHLAFEAGSEKKARNGISWSEGLSYIILVKTGLGKEIEPGLIKTKDMSVIDLRKACPSFFVRPHAQHGLLAKLCGNKTDFSENIVGIIGVPKSLALEWLGDGRLINVPSLFPSPNYDAGYARLLNVARAGDDVYGKCEIIYP